VGAPDATGSSIAFGRGTEGVVGVGSEGFAEALAFFLAGVFLATSFVVEGEGPVTGEVCRAVDVEGGFCADGIP